MSQPLSLPALSCAEVRPYLSAYADGELAEPLHSQVETHLATCDVCAQQVARYAGVDALLARLPSTTPTPEVFERVAAAVATRPSAPTVREPLAGGRRFAVPRLRRRRLEYAEWATDEARPPHPPRASRLPRWTAGAVPTLAAVLLIAMAVVAFRGLTTLPPGTGGTPTPTPAGTVLDQTGEAVKQAASQTPLAFTYVLPSYLPPTAQHVVAHVSTDGAGARLLDITWTLSGVVGQIHLREAPRGSLWEGYRLAPDLPNRSWQARGLAWRPLAPLQGADRAAVGADRGDVSFALDATVASGDPLVATVLADLRLISLSMDAPYAQRTITPLQSTGLVLHYEAAMQNASGASYQLSVYATPSQHAQRVEVRASDGTLRYVDIASGDQGIRLDDAHRSYAPLSLAQMGGSRDLTNSQNNPSMNLFFLSPNQLVQNGELWYVEETTLPNGTPVSSFLLVDAPEVTHVYVSRDSQQVVQVRVAPDGTHPGGPDARSLLAGSGGCMHYALIEYVQPSSLASAVSFATTPPSGYKPVQPGQVPPTVACP